MRINVDAMPRFDISGKVRFANDVAIELEMFAQTAALLFS